MGASDDDLAARLDVRFARVDRHFDQIHREIRDFRLLMVSLSTGHLLVIVAALAAIVARGG